MARMRRRANSSRTLRVSNTFAGQQVSLLPRRRDPDDRDRNFADDRFEEMAAPNGTVEDMRHAEFELTDREAVVVSGRPFRGRHGPRESMRPTAEERLDVGRCQGIAGGLQRGGVSAGQEAIVEALEADANRGGGVASPTVETELHRIREIGPILRKAGPSRDPRGEVVVLDDRLTRESNIGVRPRSCPCRSCALNDRILSCATPMSTMPSRAVNRVDNGATNRVLALARSNARRGCAESRPTSRRPLVEQSRRTTSPPARVSPSSSDRDPPS
jgi:hypothetical protein